MKKRLCKFQHTLFDVERKLHISSCTNHRCLHHCMAVSESICNDCPLKTPLEREDWQEVETLEEDVFSIPEEPQRTRQEVEHILDTYCLKCKHYNKESKVCQACGCMSPAPLDEGAKFKHIHCPLELW